MDPTFSLLDLKGSLLGFGVAQSNGMRHMVQPYRGEGTAKCGHFGAITGWFCTDLLISLPLHAGSACPNIFYGWAFIEACSFPKIHMQSGIQVEVVFSSHWSRRVEEKFSTQFYCLFLNINPLVVHIGVILILSGPDWAVTSVSFLSL